MPVITGRGEQRVTRYEVPSGRRWHWPRAWKLVLAAAIMIAIGLSIGGAQPFRGNTQTKVFHQSSCRYYTCTNCTAKFATAAEARESGYRPCGVCEPGGASSKSVAAADAPYRGNTNTHKFHRSSCRYAGCPNCTAKFKTRDEAIAAGFAPGGCCSP